MWWSATGSSRASTSARATSSSGCRPPGCAPTATRWPARCSSTTPAAALDEPAWSGAPHRLADELLLPSVVYAPAIAALLRIVDVRGVAHITGGGLPGNLARVLPDGTAAELRERSWEVPRIFTEIQRVGEVSDDEMRKVFNLGIGMVVVVAPDEVYKALDVLRIEGHRAVEIGNVVTGHAWRPDRLTRVRRDRRTSHPRWAKWPERAIDPGPA